jgi:DNA-binding NtrC family response regulator
LLVDDEDGVRESLKAVLEFSQFRVKTATNVPDAIHLIDTEPFDVLLSDLHLPAAGDGFTSVSAMRHRHPDAITLLFTGFPALKGGHRRHTFASRRNHVEAYAYP